MYRKFWSWFTLAIILAIFAACLIWPIWRVLRVGLFGIPGSPDEGFTFAYIQHMFTDPILREGLVNSTLLALGVTTVTMIIAIPLAMLSVRYDFRGKSLLSGLLLVPLILPPFVGAIGMRQILGRMGALTGLAQTLELADGPVDWMGASRIIGIILVMALGLYPIVFLNVSAALANLDPAMEQAAANLGASRWTIFRKITLPLMRPGLFAGGTIVLIWSFTELGTPLMFDFNRVTSVQIFQRIAQVSGSPLPYAMVIVMMAVSVLLYLVGKTLLGRSNVAGVTKASVRATTRQLTGIKGALAALAFGGVICLALLPHLGVILTSISGVGSWYQTPLPEVFTADHYINGLSHEVTIPAIQNSVKFAFVATCIDVILGILIAWIIVRSKLPGRGLIDALAMLPLAVPGLVLAFGFLAISFQIQAIGRGDITIEGFGELFRNPSLFIRLPLQELFQQAPWLLELFAVDKNPTILLVIAYAIRRLPYVVRSAVAGLQQTPPDLELAAKNIGASPLTTARRIMIPLIAANLLAGALLAFAFAMLEVSDSLILAQKQAFWPITKGIFELFQRLGDGPYVASALGVWAMALLTLTILLANNLLGKRMGAIFRV